MKKEEYKKLVDKNIKKENVLRDVLISFFIGGLMGIIGQLLTDFFVLKCGYDIKDAFTLTTIVIVIITSITTGFGFMDKLISIAKCGLTVPVTGFANSVTSEAMDYKNEGFIKGIGTNIFKLAGSIILYGIVFGFIIGVLKGVFS